MRIRTPSFLRKQEPTARRGRRSWVPAFAGMTSAIGAVCLLAALLAAPAAFAQTAPPLDASLNETIVMVPKKGIFTIELETTLYKPDGDGPFPLVLVNHGKAYGDSKFQGRYRPSVAARYFLQRGYAVVAPMRQGFSKSSGTYIGSGCNVEGNGRVQAEDVRAALDWATAQPWADKSRILVVGQSHGGWTTLAFGTENYPGVKGLVNFAGGLRQDQCTAWQRNLAAGAESYGKATKVPSLWFYGDNDSFFDPPTWKGMHERYATAGGNAKMIAFGTFGSDSHALFGARTGTRVWQPEMTAFLQSIGLPSEPVEAFAKYGVSGATPLPAPTNFAPLQDETKLPFVRDTGRAGYVKFLQAPLPRAYALAPNAAWGWADGGDDPLQRALEYCNRSGKGECKLYAVDDFVVWSAPTAVTDGR
jgi:dienelactone hydrolase